METTTKEAKTPFEKLVESYGAETVVASEMPQLNQFDQEAYNRELMANALISGGAQAAQLALQRAPTAQDARNKERLKELERLEKTGQLGLSGAERAQMERTLMSAPRALATESRQRAEARLATTGNQTSAADLQRQQMAENQQVQQSSLQAGMQISQANLNRAKEQLRELDQRTAYKAERQKEFREGIAQAIGQAAGVAGQVRATAAVPKLDLSGIAPEAQDTAMGLIAEAMNEPNPLLRQQKIQLMNQYLSQFSASPRDLAAASDLSLPPPTFPAD